MNNPNPFVPKGSLLEQQSQSRSRLKLAVFCVLAVCVTSLTAMLIQGCKREKPTEENQSTDMLTNSAPLDATNPPMTDLSNSPAMLPPATTNSSAALPPVLPPVTQPTPVAPEVTGAEYTVAKGDSLAKIAKKNGVTLKALQAANPTVVPTKLKVGQKLVIPAGGKAAAESAAPAGAAATGASFTTYTVKSGDSLHKIAKAHGTTVKAIEAANGMTTTAIKVGKKLKIPVKTAAAPVAPVAPAPAVEAAPAPVLPPTPAPAPEAAPAPAPAQ
jgi:LysM repeat protein